MNTRPISYQPIGVIRSEHHHPEKTPIQPVFAQDCLGSACIYPEFMSGLKDIDGFSHLYLIYHLHRADSPKLIVEPFLQPIERGIFATRSPWRPNAIGMSLVELVGREQNILHIKGVDILDGTPLLDLKPYSERFDHVVSSRSGWVEEVDQETAFRRGRRNFSTHAKRTLAPSCMDF